MIWGKKGVSLPHHVSMLWFSPHLPICLGRGPPTSGGAKEHSRGGQEQEGTNVEIWEHKNVGEFQTLTEATSIY